MGEPHTAFGPDVAVEAWSWYPKGDFPEGWRTCPRCDEGFDEDWDRGIWLPCVYGPNSVAIEPWHWECNLRSTLGSVGHIRGECSCYGGNKEDPPGMTRRQAAIAAVAEFYLVGRDA